MQEWKKKVDAALQMESTIASQKRELIDRLAEIERLRTDASRQSALQRDSDQLRAALDKAQTECKALQRRLEQSDSQIDQMQFGETELQALVDEMRASADATDEKHAKQIAQLEKDLGESLQCAEDLARKLAAEHDAAVQAAEIAEQACVSNQIEADRANALEAELLDVKLQLANAASTPPVDSVALADAVAALARRDVEFDALQRAMSDAQAQHDAALAALTERQAADAAAAHSKLSAALAERDSLKGAVDAMEIAVSDQALAHETQLAHEHAEVTKLRARLSAVEAERDGAQNNATQLAELETQLSEANADLALRDEQLADAVATRDELSARCAQCECSTLRQQIAALEQMAASDRAEFEQAQAALAARDQERGKLLATCSAAEHERDALKQQVSMLEQLAATDRAEFEKLQAGADKAAAAASQRIAALDQELANAVGRGNTLAEQLAAATDDADQRNDELRALRDERSALQARVDDAQSVSSERVRELEAVCERSAAQLANLERQLLEADERVVQVEGECEAANARAAACEAEVQAKASDLADAKNRLKTANTRAASTSQKQSDLEANVASRDTQIQDLQSQLQLTREIVAKHDAAAAAAVARMAQLEQQHAGCAAHEAAELAERDARLRNANTRAQNLAHELAQVNERVASLDAECQALQAQSTTLRERMAAVDSERERRIAALQDELNRRGETLDAMAQAAEDATASASAAAERLVAAENECARVSNEVAQLEERLALKDEQLELKEEQLQLQQQQMVRNSNGGGGGGNTDDELLNELQEQLASKDDELVDVMEKYNDAIVQNKALIKSIGKLEATVSALEATRRRRSPDNADEPTASMSSSPPSANNSPIVVVNLAGNKGKARSFTANKENESH